MLGNAAMIAVLLAPTANIARHDDHRIGANAVRWSIVMPWSPSRSDFKRRCAGGFFSRRPGYARIQAEPRRSVISHSRLDDRLARWLRPCARAGLTGGRRHQTRRST